MEEANQRERRLDSILTILVGRDQVRRAPTLAGQWKSLASPRARDAHALPPRRLPFFLPLPTPPALLQSPIGASTG